MSLNLPKNSMLLEKKWLVVRLDMIRVKQVQQMGKCLLNTCRKLSFKLFLMVQTIVAGMYEWWNVYDPIQGLNFSAAYTRLMRL